MIVITLPAEVDLEDFEMFADAMKDLKIRRGVPLIVGGGATVTSVPDSASFRAKRGHTPRWTRSPRAVRQAPPALEPKAEEPAKSRWSLRR